MNKIKIGALLLALIPFTAFSQDPSKAYTQKLPGATVSFDMAAIPEGKFIMGSPETEKGREVDEGPVHEVKINAFFISKQEIPWDIYELFVYKDYDVTIKTTGVDAV